MYIKFSSTFSVLCDYLMRYAVYKKSQVSKIEPKMEESHGYTEFEKQIKTKKPQNFLP